MEFVIALTVLREVIAELYLEVNSWDLILFKIHAILVSLLFPEKLFPAPVSIQSSSHLIHRNQIRFT